VHRPHHKPEPRPRSGATAATTPTNAAIGPGGEGRDGRPASADDIRRRAYRKWEEAGRPPGDGTRFWLEAERELTRGA
jgi:hypothetical protein